MGYFIMKKIIFPGSFNPVTLGHVNIIERASKMTDTLIVAVAEVSGKQFMWSLKDRIHFLEKSLEHLSNVQVYGFSGLLVDFLKAQDAHIVLRGLRSVVDWGYEVEMACVNRKLLPSLETIFLSAEEQVSSTLVRQVHALGGDIRPFVPKAILDLLLK
jgi:pantetheine-phosphate adenylyltransferase